MKCHPKSGKLKAEKTHSLGPLQTRGSKNSKLFIILISHPIPPPRTMLGSRFSRVPGPAGASEIFCGLFRKQSSNMIRKLCIIEGLS